MPETPTAMTLLILGADGQLGTELERRTAVDGIPAEAAPLARCDITDVQRLTALFDEVRPDAVINCAAWTAVDAAEDRPDAAARVNAEGARNVAALCAERAVHLCHISTDYVFDGSAAAPIPEDAPPSPRSVYGRTKLDGELAVRELCPGAQVVRTAWLYGMAGPNFVLTMLRRMDEGAPLRVVADQEGSPTWTGHLAPALLRVVERRSAGTYHLTNGGSTTWHGFAQAIADAIGSDVAITPVRTDEYPVKAARPAYSVLSDGAWRALGEEPLPHWREGLRGYLRQLGRDAR